MSINTENSKDSTKNLRANKFIKATGNKTQETQKSVLLLYTKNEQSKMKLPKHFHLQQDKTEQNTQDKFKQVSASLVYWKLLKEIKDDPNRKIPHVH